MESQPSPALYVPNSAELIKVKYRKYKFKYKYTRLMQHSKPDDGDDNEHDQEPPDDRDDEDDHCHDGQQL